MQAQQHPLCYRATASAIRPQHCFCPPTARSTEAEEALSPMPTTATTTSNSNYYTVTMTKRRAATEPTSNTIGTFWRCIVPIPSSEEEEGWRTACGHRCCCKAPWKPARASIHSRHKAQLPHKALKTACLCLFLFHHKMMLLVCLFVFFWGGVSERKIKSLVIPMRLGKVCRPKIARKKAI